MIDFIGLAVPEANRALLIAIDVVVKATILLALSYAIHAGLRRGQALARSSLWNATAIGLLLLPLASLAFPRLRVAVLPTAAQAPAVVTSPAVERVVFSKNPVSAPASEQKTPVAVARANPTPSAHAAAATLPHPAPEARIGIAGLAVALYMTVTVFLAIRLAASIGAVRGLKRRCEPVDDPAWLRVLERTRGSLRISRAVALVQSDRVSIPMVVGWLAPVIVIPLDLAQTAGGELIGMVLLHELAHVRRGDFAWNLVHRVVRLIYWPHPLIWPLGRLIGAVREQVCDDLCVHGTDGSGAYRAGLLHVASRLVWRPELSLGLALARRSNLARRLAWIDVSQGKSRCLLGLPARFTMAMAVMALTCFVGSIALERQAPAAERQVTQPRAIEVVVLAKDTGKRLAGATVRFSIDFGTSLRKADLEGVVRLDLTKRVFQDSLSFDAWADGYIQQRYFFAQNDARFPKIPAHFTLELLPGEEMLGGKVTDEQGRPIAGVKVVIWGHLGEKKEQHELAYMVDATTDEKGQWRSRCFRSMKFAYLYLSHPDYLSDTDSHPREHGHPEAIGKPAPGTPPANNQPLAGLRDSSDVQVMTAGESLAGKVTDEQGKPIAGAEVGWLEGNARETFHDEMPVIATDARGYFRFPHVRPGKLAIQVKAKGHAPELKQLDSIDMAGHLTVKLGPPRALKGRVVDSGEKPIPDAFVNIDSWRGYRSLGVFLKTDADGRFHWDDAPPEAILINASATGFVGIMRQSVSPEENQITLILKRSLSISGRITDAATDKPIDQADVEVGVDDAGTGKTLWKRELNVFAFQGRLQGSIDVDSRPEIRLRITASGYEPAVSRVFRRDENQVEFDVKLKRAQ